jgi:hypothetical protein
MAEGLFTGKDFKLNRLELIASSGQTLGLQGIYVQLQLFQDLYSSTMSGELLVNDANDIFVNFSLSGNDYLAVDIEKGAARIERVFRIYKVTERRPNKNSVSTYCLHFCSEELVISNSMRVSKSYKGQTTSDIIRDVLFNIMKVDPSRENLWEPTGKTVKYDFIVPYYRPLEVIQWAASRSYDPSGNFCYFFYEDTFGFCFQSMQSLFQQEPSKKLNLSVKTAAGESDPAQTLDSIDRFNIINDFDMISSISNGAMASRLLAVDIFSQTRKEYNYSLDIAEQNKQLLNPNKQINVMKTVDGNTNMSSYDSYFTTYVQINDTATERENSIDKWMQPRALHLSALNSFRIKVVIPGDLYLTAGSVVEIEMPQFKAPNENGKPMDKLRSCKYLVTAVNHKFDNNDIFESIVELSTDSFAESLPAAVDLTSLVIKGK